MSSSIKTEVRQKVSAAFNFDGRELTISFYGEGEFLSRLAACWNACEDEDTAMLEAIVREGTTMRKRHDEALARAERYQRELCDMERQRDELLAALDEYEKAFTEFDPSSKASRHRRRMATINARAVIAKVKGGTA